MYRTQILAAGIACASAITIKAETDAEFWGDITSAFDDVGDFFTEDVGGFFENDVGGFFNDVGSAIGGGFSDFGNWVEDDVGGFFEDTIRGAFEDAWGWVSDDANWEALGTTLLGGTVALLSGNPDEALAMWGNKEHYTGDFYDEIEEKKAAVKRNEALAQQKYQEYVAQYTEMRDVKMPGAQAKAAQHCIDGSARFGLDQEVEKVYTQRVGRGRRSRTVSYNATQKLMSALGADAKGIMGAMFESITPEQCSGVDCLHPCYGASHERACNTCLMFVLDNLNNDRPVTFTDDQYDLCDECSIPTQEVVLDPLMTFDQFLAAARAS